jgi:hypothetical protein
MFNYFKIIYYYADIFTIWIILLFFNFKLNGFYLINYISIYLLIYLVFKIQKFNKLNLILFFLFFLLALLGFLRSNFYIEPFKYIYNFFQIFLFYNYFTFRLFKNNKNILTRLIHIIEITTLLYLILAFIEFKNGTVLWFESRNYDTFLPRVNLGFGDSNSLAAFLILFSAILSQYKIIKEYYLFIIGILTFSRSFLISYLLSFFLRNKKNLPGIILILFCILFSIFYFNVLENFSFAIDRLYETNTTEDPRLAEWFISYRHFQFLPDWSIFLLSLDPHNSFLLAIELVGPFGLIIMCILFYRYFKQFFRSKKTFNVSVTLICFLIFCFFNSELFSIRNTASMGMILGIINNGYE